MIKKDRDELLVVLKDQVTFYKDQVIVLREEKTELQKQLFSLQEALVNIRAPEAYRDLIRDRVPMEPQNELEREKQRIYSQILPEHLSNIERPIFNSPEDMIRALTPVLGTPAVGAESLHENTES